MVLYTWKGTLCVFGVISLALVIHSVVKRRGRDTWNSSYDFIIVGGGPAGSVLANRLSANPNYTVLLLEAGVDDITDGNPWMNIPLFNAANFFTERLYWTDRSVRQEHAGGGCNNQEVPLLHGKVLGGSSSINMMIYARGSPDDYDRWAELGASGWSWSDVEPYFRLIENTGEDDSIADDMGKDGLLSITKEVPYHSMYKYILDASEELGVPVNPNYNGRNILGSALTQSMSRYGRRVSASTAYLNPVRDRANLHILTESQVTKVLMENKTAVGVEFMKDSRLHRVWSNKEVILSAGVYNSPQLLLLSGIGPKEHLEEHKIELVAELEGVGQNLQDHVAVSENIFMEAKPGLGLSTLDFLSFSNIVEYMLYSTGLLAENPFTAMTFFTVGNTSSLYNQSPSAAPDIQIMYAITPLGGLDPGGLMGRVFNFLNLSPFMIQNYYDNTNRPTGTSCLVSVTRPKSRGTLRLSSRDPFDRPKIDSRLLSHPYDRAVMRQGLKFLHSLMRSKVMSSVGAYILDVKDPTRERHCSQYFPYTDEHLDCYITYQSATTFHGVGTCSMGDGPQAVVDSKLRVFGVKSLRVVDASVIPSITSANIQAPIMMIAERAAQFILDDVKS